MSEHDEPERCRVVYESAKRTHIQVPAGKKGGEPVTVRVNAAGVFACLSGKCYPATDCGHVREARDYFIAQGAEPAVMAPLPMPTEGVRRQR